MYNKKTHANLCAYRIDVYHIPDNKMTAALRRTPVVSHEDTDMQIDTRNVKDAQGVDNMKRSKQNCENCGTL